MGALRGIGEHLLGNLRESQYRCQGCSLAFSLVRRLGSPRVLAVVGLFSVLMTNTQSPPILPKLLYKGTVLSSCIQL